MKTTATARIILKKLQKSKVDDLEAQNLEAVPGAARERNRQLADGGLSTLGRMVVLNRPGKGEQDTAAQGSRRALQISSSLVRVAIRRASRPL